MLSFVLSMTFSSASRGASKIAAVKLLAGRSIALLGDTANDVRPHFCKTSMAPLLVVENEPIGLEQRAQHALHFGAVVLAAFARAGRRRSPETASISRVRTRLLKPRASASAIRRRRHHRRIDEPRLQLRQPARAAARGDELNVFLRVELEMFHRQSRQNIGGRAEGADRDLPSL